MTNRIRAFHSIGQTPATLQILQRETEKKKENDNGLIGKKEVKRTHFS